MCELPQGVTVVSGGARGVDQAAAEAAREHGLPVMEILPDLDGCQQRHDFTKAYYARNQRLVEQADLLVAFTEKLRGGTWDTIKRARRLGKPVKVIGGPQDYRGLAAPPVVADGDASEVGDRKGAAAGRQKGRGPFQIKRVGLGSYALKLHRYLSAGQWADFVNAKDHDAAAAAAMMLPDFERFFDTYQFGVIHAVTRPPDRIGRAQPSPMALVCQRLAERLRVPHVEAFQPRQRRRRGRFAEHPPIVITPAAKTLIGKVVFILDDVTTTNRTLRESVAALTAIGVHAHGLAWVMYT